MKRFLPVIVAWLFVLFDGYDLIVYGTVQPRLIEEWGMSPALAGSVGSLAFLGMMIGAVVAGRLSDSIGRKKAIIGCGIVLSVFSFLCALSPSWQVFGLFRLFAGLGLGGLVPAANSLAAEYVPRRWRAAVATLMMSGVPIGGSVASLLGIPILAHASWRWMFVIALVGLVVLVPLAVVTIPRHSGSAETAPGVSTGFSVLLRPPFLAISLLFAAATLVTLTTWYGLGTWLPTLMLKAGTFDLSQPLLFALALNLGAVAGSVITAVLGDRFGPVPVGAFAAALGGIGLLLLLTEPGSGAIYVILVLAGIGSHGTQCLVIAAVTSYYPDQLRGTALGWALGVGRIGAVAAPQIGGLLLGASNGAPASNFLFFGSCAMAAAVLLAVIWGVHGAKAAHVQDELVKEAVAR
ncbi:MFS transporter [Brachybacterium kimchii]|uniref:Aromatic acid/H+ symport family MFS transporter n=1 Tax=Brachybacterium kimchii TaxID=2942909 RepID=A0ABY4N536_9MICO|nr:aromatic acid/H+ symport family MFS transporter [Brachybacterium kimchii]UQN28976.1 aromatic acid/H+ symport family MFS transporter [Brachybacterium kimchii]